MTVQRLMEGAKETVEESMGDLECVRNFILRGEIVTPDACEIAIHLLGGAKERIGNLLNVLSAYLEKRREDEA